MNQSASKAPLALAAVSGVSAALLGWRQLATAHPAEDAYILFRYAENWAAGHGIAWTPGGPPTEGATDFLWLALLTALHAAGLDIAVAAVVGNALGAALIAGLLARIAESAEPSQRPWLWLPALVVPLFHGAFAAYFGFSALFYGGVVLLAGEVARTRTRTAVLATPWLALFAGLVRPDGNVFGAGCVALAAYVAWKNDWLRELGVSLAGAAAVGIAYFVGRALYFGHTLPLPLMVKSRGGHEAMAGSLGELLPHGVIANLVWMLQPTRGPFGAAWMALVAVLAGLSWRSKAPDTRWILAGLLPAALLFLAFAAATQSQNVERRFQVPVTLVLWATALHLAVPLSRQHRWAAPLTGLGIALPVLAFAPASLGALSSQSYMDVYAPWLAENTDADDTIAVTEAGRMGYWPKGEVIDILGLNTAHTAETIPTPGWLGEQAPRVVLFHVADTMSTKAWDATGDPVLPLLAGELGEQIVPGYRAVYDDVPTAYRKDLPKHSGAIATSRWLDDNADKYDVYAVSYGGSHTHIWAFREDWEGADRLVEGLEAAVLDESFPTYFELKAQPPKLLIAAP